MFPSWNHYTIIGIGEIRVENGKQSEGRPVFFINKIDTLLFLLIKSILGIKENMEGAGLLVMVGLIVLFMARAIFTPSGRVSPR